MSKLEELRARILPRPKMFSLVEADALVFNRTSKFSLTLSGIEHPTVQLAEDKLCNYFKKHCGEDCFEQNAAIQIHIKSGNAPQECENSEEGYTLRISGQSVEIVGFGNVGILYGVISFCQLIRWENDSVTIPSLEILDWPEKQLRGLFIETRYGSNVMEKSDWEEMLDRLVEKKINCVQIGLYGCWCVQYDGQVSEYLYVPIKHRPELKTPVRVQYYSPEKQEWVEYEQLPPMFQDDFFGELVKYGKERGVTVFPTWNSLGHNTYLPTQIPEISAKDEDGAPSMTGFCTSNEATYELLFSIYDQIIDEYLLPNGINHFCIGMDEVMDGIGSNAEDIFKRRSPWCKCENCRGKSRGERFVAHAIRLIKYVKQKGITTITMYGDELLSSHNEQSLGCGKQLMEAIEREGLKENVLVQWWSYTDLDERLNFHDLQPELGLRSVVIPWTGYYHWSLLTNPLKNIQMLCEIGHRDGSEGTIAYSSWDISYDRNYDAVAEYSWGYEESGTVDDVTMRYALRHFGGRADEAYRAFRLIDYITEERVQTQLNPKSKSVSNYLIMLNKLSYYIYSYVVADKPYPRNFPGEPIEYLLEYRSDRERALYEISSMAREALQVFRTLATDSTCDMEMADRLAYECENYLCLAEDWLTLLRMYDLQSTNEQELIISLAENRVKARTELMRHCNATKEDYIICGLTMRNHSIFLQMFQDIATYVANNGTCDFDLIKGETMFSSRFWKLR